ncbi:hypothetical protein HY417_00850 [Candidatus Kaiserbacteria bacterium]|nr:hypothetical protein [Candidatus Kaiserbacteria bacterium]
MKKIILGICVVVIVGIVYYFNSTESKQGVVSTNQSSEEVLVAGNLGRAVAMRNTEDSSTCGVVFKFENIKDAGDVFGDVTAGCLLAYDNSLRADPNNQREGFIIAPSKKRVAYTAMEEGEIRFRVYDADKNRITNNIVPLVKCAYAGEHAFYTLRFRDDVTLACGSYSEGTIVAETTIPLQ